MSEFKVASRYAKSLIDLSIAEGTLETVKNDMEQFIAVLRSSTELQAVLRNPLMKQDKKRNILNAVFGGKIHPSISTFFEIMVRKGRAGILYGTAQEFVREYNEHKGIVRATVSSAVPLKDDQLRSLKEVISQEVDGTILLDNVVNPALIGGFIVQVGDRQFDASVAGKLRKLEKHFQTQ